jgi:hypothetical protein
VFLKYSDILSGTRNVELTVSPSQKKVPHGRRRPDPLANIFEAAVVLMLQSPPGKGQRLQTTKLIDAQRLQNDNQNP